MVNQTPDVTIFPYLGIAVACVFNIFLPLLSNHKAFLTASNVVKYRLNFCSQSRKFFGIPCFSRNLSIIIENKIAVDDPTGSCMHLAPLLKFGALGGGGARRDSVCHTAFKHNHSRDFFENQIKVLTSVRGSVLGTPPGDSWRDALPQRRSYSTSPAAALYSRGVLCCAVRGGGKWDQTGPGGGGAGETGETYARSLPYPRSRRAGWETAASG